MMKKLNEKKGFTLAELLIVVAIIAVLVAIAIPVFTTQLERARCATDIANLRSSYAEAVAGALAEQNSASGASYKINHTDSAVFNSAVDAAGLDSSLAYLAKTLPTSGTIQVKVDKDGVVTAVQ